MIESSNTFRLGYRPSIEGIRALSILCVMFVHADIPHLEGGFLSVDASFVVSGFLITTSLLSEWSRTGTFSIKRFYIRRALRILPTLTVMLVVWIATSAFFGWYGIGQTLKMSLFAGTYLSNWAIGLHWVKTLDAISQTWSVAIEEQFYLVFPPLLLLVLTRIRNAKAIIGAFLAVVIISAVLRWVLWDSGGSFMRIIYGTDTRGAGALALGCLLGYMAFGNHLPKSNRLKQIISILSFVGVVAIVGSIVALADKTHQDIGSFAFYGGLTLTTVSVFMIMLHMVSEPRSLLVRILENKVLVWIGHISYSLFIWHLLIYNIVKQVLNPRGFTPGLAIAEVAASVLVGTMSYYAIEVPFLRLRKRFHSTTLDISSDKTSATAP